MRWIFVLVVLMAACRPSPVENTSANHTDPNLVAWDRSPQAIVFRADIVGGDSDFRARNAIPNCTIYGDNHIVWVNELGPFQIQVLEDQLPDGAISAFVQHLTVDERIYTYQAHQSEIQATADVNPVVETVAINVNNLQHKANSFGGWPSDWFPRVLAACKSLSQAPVLVAPSSGWATVRAVPFSMQPLISTWDAQTLGLSLSAIADGAPHWISGAAASTLWNTLHSLPANLLFEDGTNYYEAALQVPGITRDAPPAPG